MAAPGSEGSARQRRAGSEGSEGGIAFGDKYIISLREMENPKTALRA